MDDVRELTAANAEFWDERKGGLGHHDPVDSVPGFSESLDRLVSFHEYSDVEIGIMFGVSRERVRQWRNRLGIQKKRHGSGKRMWNDVLGRFLTVDCDTYKRTREGTRRRIRREKQLRALLEQRRAQRDEDAARVRRVGESLGRTPTTKDVFPLTYSSCNMPAEYISVANRWGRLNGRTYQEALDALWAAAGFERPDGRRVYARRGERSPVAKLSEEQVKLIRQEYATGETSVRELAQKYGVGTGCVYAIVHRRSWKHLP
ncbi:MAG: hypothetical protein GTO22_06755 [Gemmatimonadales bacterium]|nr:hypothetical protein [Gemmatimonadales bacterium]